jgi:hypothetical protein
MDTTRNIPWDENEKRAYLNLARETARRMDPEALVDVLVQFLGELTPAGRDELFARMPEYRELYEKHGD